MSLLIAGQAFSSATDFSAAWSGAENHASRSASRRGLVGQPNQASCPLPRSGWWLPGTETSRPSQVVQKTFQPPCAGGSFLARRCTSVPQSITCASTLKPIFRMVSAATSDRPLMVGKSLGTSSTTLRPS